MALLLSLAFFVPGTVFSHARHRFSKEATSFDDNFFKDQNRHIGTVSIPGQGLDCSGFLSENKCLTGRLGKSRCLGIPMDTTECGHQTLSQYYRGQSVNQSRCHVKKIRNPEIQKGISSKGQAVPIMTEGKWRRAGDIEMSSPRHFFALLPEHS